MLKREKDTVVHIMKPSSNRSPYIFTLVQKVKIGPTQSMLLEKIHKSFAETLQVISFKSDFTYCTDEVRVKVPSFQKVILFLRY